METQSGGIKGEMAYRAYLNELSCGKFMNTLLLLTLRQAKSLERFQSVCSQNWEAVLTSADGIFALN